MISSQPSCSNVAQTPSSISSIASWIDCRPCSEKKPLKQSEKHEEPA
jgi:hypothetical protein